MPTLDQGLTELRGALLRMGGLVQRMLRRAIQALLERNHEMAHDVFLLENNVNQLHVDVDARCLNLLALHQPVAVDLRLIAAAMKINSDLERMADQAVNIGQTAYYHLFKEPAVPEADMIFRMAEIAEKMTGMSLEAFDKKDIAQAAAVLTLEDEADGVKGKIFDTLLARLPKEPVHSKQFVDIILISKNLERIADHATNIAEDVIFMVLGKDIRHALAPA